jgi:hypothetical protein
MYNAGCEPINRKHGVIAQLSSVHPPPRERKAGLALPAASLTWVRVAD